MVTPPRRPWVKLAVTVACSTQALLLIAGGFGALPAAPGLRTYLRLTTGGTPWALFAAGPRLSSVRLAVSAARAGGAPVDLAALPAALALQGVHLDDLWVQRACGERDGRRLALYAQRLCRATAAGLAPGRLRLDCRAARSRAPAAALAGGEVATDMTSYRSQEEPCAPTPDP